MLRSDRMSLSALVSLFAVLLVGLAFTPPAFAADGEQKPAQEEPPAQQEPTQLAPIEVVGTRLSAPDLAGPGPVVTLSREEIEASGFTQLGQLINSMSFLGAARNTHFNANGTGRVLANIHNLGANRTLVLVNGQRWIPTVGGPVDLTTIPLSIVQRVEVLLDGASAIYGSDAIAGVINIVTVRNFSGAELGAEFGGYAAHDAGGGFDGKTRQIHFTIGTANDRSSVLLVAGYSDANPVFAGDRDISRFPVAGFGNLLGSPVTPDGHLILNTNNPGPYAGLCAAAGSGPFAFHCDIGGPLTPGSAHPFGPADLYNTAAKSLILTGQERWHIYSQGHYEFNDWVTFSYMTLYERRNATEITPPGGWSIGAMGRVHVDGLPVGISGTNIYNPFPGDPDLVPAAPGTPTFAAWCQRYGTGAGGGCTSNAMALEFLGIRPLGQGLSRITQNLTNFYFNGGFSGGFTLFENPWHWGVHYAYGQSLEAELRHGGHTIAARLQSGLGPNCASTPGCVPLNFFNGSTGVTRKMLDFTNFNAHFISRATIRDYNAGLHGAFFNAWYAGPWQLAAGYEHRKSTGLFEPGAAVSKGLYIGFPIQPTKGSKNSDSEYAELGIPLIENQPFAQDVSLNLAIRFTQAEWSGRPGESGPAVGGSGDASSGRASLRWQFNDHWLLRATWSQGYRVPGISELFSAQSLRPTPLVDPCAANQALPPSQQRDLPACPNAGHGGASQPLPTIPVLSGGNPKLDPESSVTRTAGIVWSPRFAPRLSVSADYYHVEITDAVSTIGPQALLDGCYVDNISSYCDPIVRKGGIIRVISATRFNAGSLRTAGWDITAHYVMPATPIGIFSADFTANFTLFRTRCNVVATASGTASRCHDSAGEVHVGRRSVAAVPKKRMALKLGWSYAHWELNWNVYLIGPLHEKCSASRAATVSPPPWPWCSNNADNTNRLGTTVYNDVQASYTVPDWDTTFTLGVNNILSRDPPIAMTYSPGMFLPVYYRIPGRFVYGRISVRF